MCCVVELIVGQAVYQFESLSWASNSAGPNALTVCPVGYWMFGSPDGRSPTARAQLHLKSIRLASARVENKVEHLRKLVL